MAPGYNNTKLLSVLIFLTALLPLSSISGQNPSPESIEFNKSIHDFGYMDLNSGKHTYSFTFKNVSDKPVVIHTVISSCGCTTPQWTKSPVLPGESGKITVTFLNDQGPYPFDKTLTVYVTGSPKPIILRIKGIVTAKPKPLKQQYPEKYAQIGFRKSILDFGMIKQGALTRGALDFANLSTSAVSVTFTNVSKGLYLGVSPEKTAPGTKGEITFEIDTRSSDQWGLTRYKATPVVNGKKCDREIIIETTIREDFGIMSRQELDQAALPMAERSSHNFGSVKTGTSINTTFEIKNIGKKELLIHKIDVSDTVVRVNYPSAIQPGANGRISVSVGTSGQSLGSKLYTLTLITNSPTRPVVNLLISGDITK
jgi:hypothetical protein